MSNPALPHDLDPKFPCGDAKSGQEGHEKISAEKSMQAIEKARFGRENPRKSKRIQPLKTGVFVMNGDRQRKSKRRAVSGAAAGTASRSGSIQASFTFTNR
jgi:hypothetical protein